MNPNRTVFRHLLLPISVLGLLSFIIYKDDIIPALFWKTLPMLFYAGSLAAALLSWHFNRSRFIFILIPVVALFWALGRLEGTTLQQMQNLAAPALLLHLIVFLLIKERGLLNRAGLLNALITFTVPAAVSAMLYYGIPDLAPWSEKRVFSDAIHTLTPFWDLTLIGIVCAVPVLLLMAYLHHQVIYHTAALGIYLCIIAALSFGNDTPRTALALSGTLAMIFGILIQESYRLAFYDELTGLPGRRALVEAMAKLGRRYVLAMVDIDHFKKFNDTYGHDTGDDVLKMVAARLGDVGGGGKAYRYGGEEFTILFPAKSLEHAFEQMDAVRQTIADTPFKIRQRKGDKPQKREVRIHISAGIVEKAAKEKDPFTVMKRADNALYKAKKLGRNRVVKG